MAHSNKIEIPSSNQLILTMPNVVKYFLLYSSVLKP